jgi:hypothetical protein
MKGYAFANEYAPHVAIDLAGVALIILGFWLTRRRAS